ncbi:MAG: hypothetical protein AAB552_04010 [Patescibacteria group bacterium]
MNTLLSEAYHSPQGYLWRVLPVEKFVALPATVEVDNIVFAKKSEFHVTVANARGIARAIGGQDIKMVAEVETNLQKMLMEYVHDAPIEMIHFENDFRLAVSPGRMSIAARCVVTNLEGFFHRIKSEYGKDFPVQPPHVSLYTQNGAAVGIDSTEQMESFKKVELPVVQRVLGSAL